MNGVSAYGNALVFFQLLPATRPVTRLDTNDRYKQPSASSPKKRRSDDRMSQPAHKSRTTQFIYRFDMNSTFDLSDLSCLSKALASLQVGLMRPHFAGPPWSVIFRYCGFYVRRA